jgi:uncharacterized Zn finger protein
MARRRSGRHDRYSYQEGFPPYVSVGQRSRLADSEIAALRREGRTIEPVRLRGSAIARTFWGKAWCENLEAYSDFANRLPRGRAYVRAGTVIDLQIDKGHVTAMVRGSSLYRIDIRIATLDPARWSGIVKSCSSEIGSLVALLQGRFSPSVMETITSRERGMFPSPEQITMRCSCPDSATMCKHVAAVLYGVGARLDERPELFFVLRNVDHNDLVVAAGAGAAATATTGVRPGRRLKSKDLSAIFGIDIEMDDAVEARKKPAAKSARGAKRKARTSV